jgi:hypothetical protein
MIALFAFLLLAVAAGVWGIVSGRARVSRRVRAVLMAAAAATPGFSLLLLPLMPVLTRVLLTAICLSMAGAIAAFVYRRSMRALERA